MGLAALARAVASMPPPPCDGCPHRDRCASLKLACEQFFVYTDRKKGAHVPNPLRVPSKRLYNIVFNDTGKNLGPVRMWRTGQSVIEGSQFMYDV